VTYLLQYSSTTVASVTEYTTWYCISLLHILESLSSNNGANIPYDTSIIWALLTTSLDIMIAISTTSTTTIISNDGRVLARSSSLITACTQSSLESECITHLQFTQLCSSLTNVIELQVQNQFHHQCHSLSLYVLPIHELNL